MVYQITEVGDESQATHMLIPPIATKGTKNITYSKLYPIFKDGVRAFILDDQGNPNDTVLAEKSTVYFKLSHESRSEQQLIELISSISYLQNSEKFRHTYHQIIRHKEAAIPYLTHIVKDEVNRSQHPHYVGHVYALYLLAELGAKELFPIIVNSFMLEEIEEEHPMAHYLQDDGARILASVFDGNLTLLQLVIESKHIYPYARSQAIRALVILVFMEKLEREKVQTYYKYLFKQEVNWAVMTQLVMASTALYPDETYKEIQFAYEQGKVDEWFITLENVHQTLLLTKEIVLHISSKDTRLQQVGETNKS